MGDTNDTKEDTKEAKEEKKRKTTSAVPYLSVSQVRKALQEMRAKWTTYSESHATPFSGSQQLLGGVAGLTMEKFAFDLQIGHAKKRHAKAVTPT